MVVTQLDTHCARPSDLDAWQTWCTVEPRELASLAVPWVNLPEDCFLHGLKSRFVSPSKRWYSPDGERIYTWDGEHGGEVEVFNKRGRHLGVAHPVTREMIKPAVRGRRIDV
ncbi:colicin E3/pyocin S6 family cytotoxin [Streptomyces sp. NPDC057636]|uniref:colicin E3/pyocin S6 family cytotoxin n=1 Tax=Streptomyces sp. NPDC057636 TaxID=3346189 RepID=UPI0036CD7EF7